MLRWLMPSLPGAKKRLFKFGDNPKIDDKMFRKFELWNAKETIEEGLTNVHVMSTMQDSDKRPSFSTRSKIYFQWKGFRGKKNDKSGTKASTKETQTIEEINPTDELAAPRGVDIDSPQMTTPTSTKPLSEASRPNIAYNKAKKSGTRKMGEKNNKDVDEKAENTSRLLRFLSRFKR